MQHIFSILVKFFNFSTFLHIKTNERKHIFTFIKKNRKFRFFSVLFLPCRNPLNVNFLFFQCLCNNLAAIIFVKIISLLRVVCLIFLQLNSDVPL